MLRYNVTVEGMNKHFIANMTVNLVLLRNQRQDKEGAWTKGFRIRCLGAAQGTLSTSAWLDLRPLNECLRR